MHAATVGTITVLLALGAIPAQDAAPADPLAEVAFRVAVDDLVEFQLPGDAGWTTLVDVPYVIVNLGLHGTLSLLAPGQGRLVEAADGVAHFERLRRAADVDLLHALGAPPGDARVEFERVLAATAVADRGLKPALGVLRRLVDDASLPASSRAAARRAAAALRGEAAPAPAIEMRAPLAEALAGAPDADLFLHLDQDRLPSPRAVLQGARGLLAEELGAEMAAVRGDTARFASLVRRVEGPGALPLRLARAVGNVRVVRTLLAVSRPPESGRPRLPWVSFETLEPLDHERIRTAARAGGLDVHDGPDGTSIVGIASWPPFDGAHELVVGARQIVLRPVGVEPLAAAAADDVARAIAAGDAAASLIVRRPVFADAMNLDASSPVLEAVEAVHLDLPIAGRSELRLRARFAEATAAQGGEMLVRGLVSMAGARLARIDGLDELAAAVEEVVITVDEGELEIVLPWSLETPFREVFARVVRALEGG